MDLARCKTSVLANLLIGWLVFHSSVAKSYSDAGSVAGPDAVHVGITGHYRVGRWTSVRLDPSVIDDAGSSSVAIETTDGDGVRVRYDQDVSAKNHRRAYAIPGGEAAPLVIRAGDDDDQVLSTRFPTYGSPAHGASMIPLGMPWIVSVGDPMGIEKIGANDLLKRDASVAVSRPMDAHEFPDASLGYEGVDLMVVTGRGLDLLSQLDVAQQSAVTDWVTDGGHLLITMGASTKSWIDDAPWMLRLLPVNIDELSIVTIDPTALETFTSTRVPLQAFQGAKLPREVGNPLVVGRTTRRISTPIASRYSVGFGQVTVVAADLDEAPFVDWPDRLGLITQLTGSLLAKQDTQSFPTNRATAFDDLAGQTRSTLDQFAMKRKLGFSVISLILLSLVAAIGPLDYLLINRLLGKPLLGWLTFPLMAIGLSAVLVYQSKARAGLGSDAANAVQEGQNPLPNESGCAVNRLEIVDIDVASGSGRVFSWNVIYSHPSNRIGVNVIPGPTLKRFASKFDSSVTNAFGFPGAAFGGIQIAGEDLRMPPYRVAISNRQSTDSAAVQRPLLDCVVEGLPLAPRSSKSLATKILFQADNVIPVEIRQRAGSELLAGELVNPLPVDLLDGMLVYRNWTYLLPTRFPSGASIPSVDSLRQKNFRWQLSRKKALESSSEGEIWNASDVGSIGRVAEMLMFHDAVGGTRYTGLKHDPLATLDLSHLLTDEQCVLVGRLATSATVLQLSNDSNEELSASGDSHTMIRVVLPVRPAKAAR